MRHGARTLEDRLLFDRKDHELLGIVHDVLGREDLSGVKHLLTPYLHPRGIKETAASQGLRTAYAAANLLGSLEIGKAHDRINALRALQAEAMSTAATHLKRNTARVLMQIMKELVRTEGDPRRQLELARDFRAAATGKPRVVARQLRQSHLALMPEEWNQVSFDNHVHDANTKGRKSATHLIMDAWIKGIRHLTVIYYNFVPEGAAEELLSAAEIMGITVRIGIEFQTRYREKQAKIIWVPRGFSGRSDFLAFLRHEEVVRFMSQGQRLAQLQQEQLLHVLGAFNDTVLPDFNSYFGLNAQPFGAEGFLAAVGSGQASLVHLGKYLHAGLMPHLQARHQTLEAELAAAAPDDRTAIAELMEELDLLDADALMDDYLESLVSREIPDDGEAAPLYCASQGPMQLIEEVTRLRAGNRFILNLCCLDSEDVLDILRLCRGRITHLETVNLRNSAMGQANDPVEIARLQHLMNRQSLIPLKRWVLGRMDALRASDAPEAPARLERLETALRALPSLHAQYRDRPLRTSMGSDSTGQSCRGYGMGMVARETLPPAARKASWAFTRDAGRAMVVGLRVDPRTVREPRESSHTSLDSLYAWARRTRGMRWLGFKAREEFKSRGFFPARPGESNILIMGGVKKGCGNALGRQAQADPAPRKGLSWTYLTTGLKNTLKVLAGFLPAMLTFLLTKDWWVLSWFGAVIWFAITGLRNVIQSVLGGGGISRTPLLKWNDYVSVDRLCESLMFTGFSVPLLDFFVKTLFLDRGLGVSVATSPTLLYTVMAMVNGLYICSHNLYRGLPRKAAFLNLLRSAFSIPLAMGFSAALGAAISAHDPSLADPILQQWAAVISKLASDCVAGIIEGLADRESNMAQRLGDYRDKIEQMLAVQEKLEILHPTVDGLDILAEPKRFVADVGKDRPDLVNAVIVNSLDFLYFWMYQPRGRQALARVLAEMDPKTRQIFSHSQQVLVRKREISQLFLDGLLGKNFSKGLAFYLDHSEGYLEALEELAPLERGA
ncbi:hypothetical protein NNJEOMEG_01072 [Fundidesulfovibrio magnetotacticus]|uniref:Uncharacterized protein n=1 Tax=Fundidesulfovibrio magnetotacticus TaxID=2730080 RepID=A0A6V8LRR1_9BACT|nr:hypothetical protein [Fundidesulfovibrio magnetotacticus]GFK93241.1 hypothetical protein NNJEOMEG_01072 [Fundidesulfovibrio magnetotacticus]